MPATLHQTWLETLRRDPGALALAEAASGRTWTRAELQAAAESWRNALPPQAELKGNTVVFALPNGIEWLSVFLGLQAAGAVVAALDPQEPVDAQDGVAAAIGARWLWRDGRLQHAGAPTSAAAPLPRGVCLVKLTSGSTGAPKAFPFTHAQMLADGRQVCSTMDIGPADLNLAVIPFGHSYGLGNLVVPLVAQGTAIVCAASPLPHALAADCGRWQPTIFPAVPALLRALAASDLTAESLARLRVIISAGAPLPAGAAAAFAAKFARPVHNFYGSSETGGICYDRTGDSTLSGRSVGPPLDGVTLHFRAGRRFTVTSAAVMGRRGRHSVADRGELNSLGELVLLGRADRGVKIAGRRLDLGEVETALRAVPGVRDACVVPHPQRPEALAAAVATDLDADAIRTALSARLAAWKIPARLMIVGEFPLTARGKTDLQALRAALGKK